MVALSVQIEIAAGLGWERWQRIVPLVDRLGYRGLYVRDHFQRMDLDDDEGLQLIAEEVMAQVG